MNRALVLRNLGRFTESMTANTTAIQLLCALGQPAEVGHAQQTLAFTYYVLGRYTEALTLLDEARTGFLRDSRPADLLVTDLYRSHCLLEMRRFADVIAASDQLAALAARLGQPVEEGQALFNKAVALAGLTHRTQALDLLTAARALFTSAGNAVWAAQADLEAAHLLLQVGRLDAASAQATRCATLFTHYQLPIHHARAQLIEAEARLLHDDPAGAAPLLHAITQVAIAHQIPALGYRAQYLLGQAAEKAHDRPAAGAHYAAALANVEQLRGRLMVEFRADFLADKAEIYAAAVRLCLAQGQLAAAHAYADRARSRGLHDLLALRLDLRIQPRNAADQPLVDELNQLRQARDQHYRRALHAQEFAAIIAPPATATAAAPVDEITPLEEQITARWHTLLVRNADYARDDLQGELTGASSTADADAQVAALQARLPADTLLLSYYVTDRDVTLFLLDHDGLVAKALPTSAAQIQRLADLLRLNLTMAAGADAVRMPALLLHVQKILHQLYQQLLASVQDDLARVNALVIAPHGPLHYVPFHALVTHLDPAQPHNSRYLLDQQTISYLPGAAFLATARERRTTGELITLGHSYGGQLPHAVAEAEAIATLAGGHAFVEDAATKAQLQAVATTARVLHLATHGDFRADNPLFSGLALDDGWLSTLDIFHLQTSATLVTLSACRTGRHVIGGGDELLGLMRAFLAAGAASIVMSHWAVHDESTAQLMQHFYRALLAGQGKGTALRHAQLALRDLAAVDGAAQPYAHPYFWAPFLLIGDAGQL
jgi:CHAT domain-containing protein